MRFLPFNMTLPTSSYALESHSGISSFSVRFSPFLLSSPRSLHIVYLSVISLFFIDSDGDDDDDDDGDDDNEEKVANKCFSIQGLVSFYLSHHTTLSIILVKIISHLA